MLKGSVPSAPSGEFLVGTTGENARLANGIAPMSFYLSLYRFISLSDAPAPQNVLGAADGNGELSASDCLSGQIKTGLPDGRFIFCIRQGGRA